MRTVRNKKLKRAVLLKRTMSTGKRRLCKSPKKSQRQLSWDERARVVKLKAVQRISKKVTDFAYIKYFFEILRFVCGGDSGTLLMTKISRVWDICTALSEVENNPAFASKLSIYSPR